MEAIETWMIIILLVVIVVLGSMTYHYHNQKVTLQAEAVTLTENLRASEANVVLAQKSCEITTTVTEEVSTKIEDKQQKMTKTLVEMASIPPSKGSTNGKKYVDDDNLSPDLMRLLDKAYCDAQPSDASCSAAGAKTDVPSTKTKK